MTALPLQTPGPRGGVAREMGLLADGIERYCTDSLTLARLEIGQGARSMAGDVARVGLFAMLLGLGYGLASVALALSLAASIGTVWAFLAVGAVNALAGVLGLKIVARRLLAGAP